MSDKIHPHHLQRRAVLYIRQSSTFQAAHHLESQKLQYAMQDRLRQLGWTEIEVVDDDLGRSASGSVTRAGFERMIAEVCLGHVGAVAAREVSRFARNSRDWQQLVEVCRLVDTLLIDQESVYSPRQSNDRLLLGVKGSLNEYELDLLRQRAWEARLEKARRGELVVAAPVGFVKTEDQRLEKDPDLRVQEALCLVFRKFEEIGAVRQTLLWFLEEELPLPARHPSGATVWRRPSYASLYHVLTNPTYGGAYAYGKTGAAPRPNASERGGGRRRKPQHEWLVLIPGKHDGYISWEQFQQIQRRIAANVLGETQPGAVKRGAALLAGLLRCRRCGRKLLLHYTGREHDMLRYACRRGWLDQGEPRCITFGGVPVDEAIRRELLRVVQPAAVEAARLAGLQAEQTRDEVLSALERELEAARYAAGRSAKQFDAADPENRLVAGELERRWEQALQRVRDLEQRVVERKTAGDRGPPPSDEEFQNLAHDLEAVWSDPSCDVRLQKRIVQALIHEVVADVDEERKEIILVIHWQGGIHTELRLPRRGRGQCRPTAADIVAAVRVLARTTGDREVAGILNRHGLRTGRGNRWTTMRVTSLRNHHGIACHRPEVETAEGWLNLNQAAAVLGVAPRTLRLAAQKGEIPSEHPLPEGPWEFRRAELHTAGARRIVERAHQRNGRCIGAKSKKRTSRNQAHSVEVQYEAE
ncbi:MAG TPA: recombinase family protein [Gemmataceae bacterium]|jgi:DNA invertase Pin-like site-specific DNA recombinase